MRAGEEQVAQREEQTHGREVVPVFEHQFERNDGGGQQVGGVEPKDAQRNEWPRSARGNCTSNEDNVKGQTPNRCCRLQQVGGERQVVVIEA